MDTNNTKFAQFNKFQQAFYTSIEEFQKFSYHEICKHSFMLLSNMIKGYPLAVRELMQLYSPDVKILTSPAVLIALQHKFVNNFSRKRVPNYIYWKTHKKGVKNPLAIETDTDKGVLNNTKGKGKNAQIMDSIQVWEREKIMSLLFLDLKTFEYLKERNSQTILNILKNLRNDTNIPTNKNF